MTELEFFNAKEAEKYFAYTSPLVKAVHHLHEAHLTRQAFKAQRILVALSKLHNEINNLLQYGPYKS